MRSKIGGGTTLLGLCRRPILNAAKQSTIRPYGWRRRAAVSLALCEPDSIGRVTR